MKDDRGAAWGKLDPIRKGHLLLLATLQQLAGYIPDDESDPPAVYGPRDEYGLSVAHISKAVALPARTIRRQIKQQGCVSFAGTVDANSFDDSTYQVQAVPMDQLPYLIIALDASAIKSPRKRAVILDVQQTTQTMLEMLDLMPATDPHSVH